MWWERDLYLYGFPFMWVVSFTEMCRLLSVCTERKDDIGGECFRASGPLISVLCILHINACGCGVYGVW